MGPPQRSLAAPRYWGMLTVGLRHTLPIKARRALELAVKQGAPTTKRGKPAVTLTEPVIAQWFANHFQASPEMLTPRKAARLASGLYELYNSPGIVKTTGVPHATVQERLELHGLSKPVKPL